MFYCITADYLRHSDNNIVSAPACVFHDTRCAAHKIILKIALGPNLISDSISVRGYLQIETEASAHIQRSDFTPCCVPDYTLSHFCVENVRISYKRR